MGGGCSRVKDALDERNPWVGGGNGQHYAHQPKDHYDQLNTDKDLNGQTLVLHIYKKTRDVMGQPAADLASNAVEWAEYGIVFKSRPSPYDFPAFEKKDDGVNRMSMDLTKTMSEEPVRSSQSIKPDQSKKRDKISKLEKAAVPGKSKSDDKVSASRGAATDKPAGSTNKAPEKSKKAAAKAPPTAKPKVSHNAEMDNCSIEE